MFKKLAKYTMHDEQFLEYNTMLIDSQKAVLDYIQTNKRRTLHILITGGAGTGKSFMLRLLKETLLRENTTEYPNVLVAAPTGVAAYNINGHTLHKLLQLPTQDKSNAQYCLLLLRVINYYLKLSNTSDT